MVNLDLSVHREFDEPSIPRRVHMTRKYEGSKPKGQADKGQMDGIDGEKQKETL